MAAELSMGEAGAAPQPMAMKDVYAEGRGRRLTGLVLVEHFNQLSVTGMAMATVVREGARRRLRPVLMTASITGLGLVPLLFASGPGSEIQRPLAIVVIGGLVSSTALTLLLLPVLFRRFGAR